MTQHNQNIEDQICKLEKQLKNIQSELVNLHSKKELEEVNNFEFEGIEGNKYLSDLFSNNNELIVIHNMGISCNYCTLWADGFNGISEHLQSRAAFALTSPTEFKKLSAFADKRGWRFPYFSTIGTDFQESLGVFYKNNQKETMMSPAMSTFIKQDNKIFRKTSSGFGPGDLYCSLWHMFDLLPTKTEWQPKISYN